MITKKECESFHKQHKDFNKLEIDLNGEDVSDLIVIDKNNGRYRNIFTGSVDSDLKKVIREGRKFYVISLNPEEKPVSGFYTKHDKELDALVIVSARLKRIRPSSCLWQWVEVDRTFIHKNYGTYKIIDMLEDDGCIDMKSQSYYVDGMEDKDFIDTNNGSYEELASFFKNCIYDRFFGSYHRTGFIYAGVSALRELMNIHSKIYEKENLTHDCVLALVDENDDMVLSMYESDIIRDGGVVSFLDKSDMPIPEAAYNKMTELARKWVTNERSDLNGLRKKRRKHLWKYDEIFETSIVQKDGKKVILRSFYVHPIWRYPIENMEFIIRETRRVIVDNCYCCKFNDYICDLVAWCDDLTETCIQYSSYFLEKSVKMMEELTDEGRDHYDMLYKMTNDMRVYYKTHPDKIFHIAAIVGTDRVLEAFLNYECACKQDLNLSILYSISHLYDMKTCSKALFGEVDCNENSLEKMLLLPKGFLDLVYNNTDVGYSKNVLPIRIFKEMFSEDMDYFKRMNRDDLKRIIELTNGGYDNLTVKSMTKLIKLYGTHNLRGYIDYMEEVKKKPIYSVQANYGAYLNMLYDLKDIVKNARWRLKDNEIITAIENLEPICEIWRIGNIAAIKRQYEKRQEEWKWYCYEADGFIIRQPETMQDVINEGVALNHCAKKFVEAAGVGETTILFIRKADAPEKPYYTLEVRDGRIRQCHGFDNVCVEEGSQLDDFLKSFCKDKNIVYNIGSEALAV